MTDLAFSVLGVEPEPFAASPNLTARLRITERSGSPVHALALRCQVRIEPHRRGYSDAEAEGLLDLFGPRARWTSTLRTFLWMHADTVVQGFADTCEVDLPMPCTYDFEVTASKYLHALDDAAVPLLFLFSGTVFTRGTAGFGVEQIPWDREARYDLPVPVWRALIRTHFPSRGWVRMDEDVLRALNRYRAARGLLDLDSAIATLLQGAGEAVS
ncbi:DUF6084 family protein [Rhodococcus sp. NPDC127528]|uniref:DUF6084 family protein n=1 Tax=unclassified Rhodococcus (in: high G+C Gram-positive bacteria) TaxID=192944 RepID=UPI00363FB263